MKYKSEASSETGNSGSAGLNWAGNYRYAAELMQQPRTVGDVRSIVQRSPRVKALGSRHSFNDIADSPAVQISTEHLNAAVAIDEDAMTVRVGSGLRYADICRQLNERGYALHNLASLPHISVAGACATATHGSGVGNGNLATAVKTIEFVDGSGNLVRLHRESDAGLFAGAVVGLGALGIVTSLTLQMEKAFRLAQYVFLNLPFAELEEHFDGIMAAGYSVSLFTTWRAGFVDQVWVKRRAGDQENERELFGAKAAKEDLHPIPGMPAENCTPQMGVEGNWYERLPHFRMGYTPSSGEELQAEYFVDRRNAVDAMRAIAGLADEMRPYLLVSEVRAVAADDLWLSPQYKRDSAAFHFTWRRDSTVPCKILQMIERELAPFAPRPHWGKLFSMNASRLRDGFERYSDFLRLVELYDPAGKFRNAFLDRLFAA